MLLHATKCSMILKKHSRSTQELLGNVVKLLVYLFLSASNDVPRHV